MKASIPSLRALWEANGAKTSGTWAQVFGDTPRGDEIFMAWHYARFIQGVTAKGKAAYDLPMYVNTWLAGDDSKPGSYPERLPRAMGCRRMAGGRYGTRPLCARPLRPQTSSSGAGAITAPAIRSLCRRPAEAKPVPPTSSTHLEKKPASAFRPSPLKTTPMPTATSLRATANCPQLAPILAEHQAAGDAHGFVLDQSPLRRRFHR